jgi:hypothetical protein
LTNTGSSDTPALVDAVDIKPLRSEDESATLAGLWLVCASSVFATLNWLPVRITAAIFAVVGNFEDAVNCWRTQADDWPDKTTAYLLSSGAGAIGVQLACRYTTFAT